MVCALKPAVTTPARRVLTSVGFLAFKNAMPADTIGLKRLCPVSRRKLLMSTLTSPKSIFTGHGFTQRWHTVQCSAMLPSSSKCFSDTPRRVCSSYKNASASSPTPKILLRGEYSRLARGTWVLHTGLHLPQRRQSFTASVILPKCDCSIIRLSKPSSSKDGV